MSVCKCGHPEKEHVRMTGKCFHWNKKYLFGPLEYEQCGCNDFVDRCNC